VSASSNNGDGCTRQQVACQEEADKTVARSCCAEMQRLVHQSDLDHFTGCTSLQSAPVQWNPAVLDQGL
jgi:hypothetical protein